MFLGFQPQYVLRFRILELRNRVLQNDVTLRVTNSKMFIEIILSSYLLDFVKYQIKFESFIRLILQYEIKFLFAYLFLK